MSAATAGKVQRHKWKKNISATISVLFFWKVVHVHSTENHLILIVIHHPPLRPPPFNLNIVYLTPFFPNSHSCYAKTVN